MSLPLWGQVIRVSLLSSGLFIGCVLIVRSAILLLDIMLLFAVSVRRLMVAILLVLKERGTLMKSTDRNTKHSTRRAFRRMWKNYCKSLRQTSSDNSTSPSGLQTPQDKCPNRLTKLSTWTKLTLHSVESMPKSVQQRPKSRSSKRESKMLETRGKILNGLSDSHKS